jgi:hypothetical protein
MASVLVVVALAAAVPLPVAGAAPSRSAHARPAVKVAYLTRRHDETLTLTRLTRVDVVTDRHGNSDPNIRMVWWNANERARQDEVSCTSFTAIDTSFNASLIQEGVALRVQRGAAGLRALTVTKNIYAHAVWNFNLHWWKVSPSGTVSLSRIAWFNMSAALVVSGKLSPTPWNLCARAVGTTVTILVWPSGEATPAWSDPVHAASATVPGSWVYPGLAGWYVGHDRTGGTVTYAHQWEAPLP